MMHALGAVLVFAACAVAGLVVGWVLGLLTAARCADRQSSEECGW